MIGGGKWFTLGENVGELGEEAEACEDGQHDALVALDGLADLPAPTRQDIDQPDRHGEAKTIQEEMEREYRCLFCRKEFANDSNQTARRSVRASHVSKTNRETFETWPGWHCHADKAVAQTHFKSNVFFFSFSLSVFQFRESRSRLSSSLSFAAAPKLDFLRFIFCLSDAATLFSFSCFPIFAFVDTRFNCTFTCVGANYEITRLERQTIQNIQIRFMRRLR